MDFLVTRPVNSQRRFLSHKCLLVATQMAYKTRFGFNHYSPDRDQARRDTSTQPNHEQF